MKLLRATASLLFCLVVLSLSVSAQTSTGGVNGTISDPNGAAVPGSTVRLVNQATSIETRATTNESGYFTFVNVNPGTYFFTVEANGCSTAQTPPFDVGVNQVVPQNIALTVVAVSQTVEVVAAGEMLQPSSAELGTVIPKEAVQDLPLNGRNFTQLLSLTPGATPVNTAQGGGVTFQDAGPTGIPGTAIVKPSLHGQQNRSTLYFQDGFINTDLRGPIYGIPPIVDVIQEFKVQGHNGKSEYGGVTGGIVNVVSRSGGNSYHGSAYEFVRNDAFDARNPFSDSTRLSPAPFRQNQFGGTFGGRIIKNKTFFFAAFEGWRFSKPTGDQAYIPTAAELVGDFTNSPQRNQNFNPYSTRRNPANQNQFIRDPFKCASPRTPTRCARRPSRRAVAPPTVCAPTTVGSTPARLLPPRGRSGISDAMCCEAPASITWTCRCSGRFASGRRKSYSSQKERPVCPSRVAAY